MPTKDEINELIEHTNNKWIELDGIKGRKFISKKDNKKWIFIPAAGCFDGSFYGEDRRCCVWSASINSNYVDNAYCLYFYSDDCYSDDYGTCSSSYSVRGVVNT